MRIFKGWIIGLAEHEPLLREIGVEVLSIADTDNRDPFNVEWNVRVPEAVLHKLGPYWMKKFIWGLEDEDPNNHVNMT